jgi:hypothetical protein
MEHALAKSFLASNRFFQICRQSFRVMLLILHQLSGDVPEIGQTLLQRRLFVYAELRGVIGAETTNRFTAGTLGATSEFSVTSATDLLSGLIRIGTSRRNNWIAYGLIGGSYLSGTQDNTRGFSPTVDLEGTRTSYGGGLERRIDHNLSFALEYLKLFDGSTNGVNVTVDGYFAILRLH